MDVKTIGVAIDGSSLTSAVLDMAAFEAQVKGVERIVIAYALPSAVDLADGVMSLPQSTVDEMIEAGERTLGKASQQLSGAPCAVETRLLSGRDAADALSEFFDGCRCDLVIMGNRGLGGVKGYLGSVSRKVLLRATCPVLIVK